MQTLELFRQEVNFSERPSIEDPIRVVLVHNPHDNEIVKIKGFFDLMVKDADVFIRRKHIFRIVVESYLRELCGKKYGCRQDDADHHPRVAQTKRG